MAKVTFATREFIEGELDSFRSEVDNDLREQEIKNSEEHEGILESINRLETNVNENLKNRIDEVERSFNDSLGTFKTEVEGDLEELSKNILVENIRYKNQFYPEIANVKDTLDKLLYFDTELTTLNSSAPQINLMGTVLSNIDITWEYNKPSIVSQNIDGVPIAKSNRSYRYPSNISTDQVIRLTYNDGVKEYYEELRYIFVNKIYYGTVNSITDINLSSIDSAVATERENILRITAAKGAYIVYALPIRLGTPRFFVGGLEGGFVKVKEMGVPNSTGFSEQYSIWRSVQPGLGDTIIDIK